MAEQSSPGATPEAGPQATPEPGQSIQGELRPVWPAPPTPARGAARRWGLAARIAATVGGLLFFVAAWTPWATALTSGSLCNPAGSLCIFSLTPAEIGAPPISTAVNDPSGAFVYWSLLTTLGALLAPLLWQRTHPWLMWLAAAAYTAWTALCVAVLITTSQLFFQTIPALSHAANGPYTAAIQPVNISMRFFTATPAFGIYLAAVALVATLAALVLAVIALVAAPPILRPSQTIHGEVAHPGESQVERGARRSIPGAGAVTGGLLLWALGFWLMPLATYACPQTVVSGQCPGLPTNLAMEASLLKANAFLDPAAAHWAIGALLLIGAAMTLIAVWLREITRTLCVWLSAWLVFALACALMAINGAQLIVHGQIGPNVPAGQWHGNLGTIVIFLGLLVIFTGLAPLWASAIRTAPRRDPPTA